MEWLNHWIQETNLWGLFLSAFISSTVAPGGSEVVLGYLIRSSSHPAWYLVLIASVGNTLGALTTWLLGSWTGRHFPLESTINPKHQTAVRWVKRYGSLALLFSWLPVIGDGICYAAGWLKIPFLLSLATISVGKVGRYTLVAYLVQTI